MQQLFLNDQWIDRDTTLFMTTAQSELAQTRIENQADNARLFTRFKCRNIAGRQAAHWISLWNDPTPTIARCHKVNLNLPILEKDQWQSADLPQFRSPPSKRASSKTQALALVCDK
jgi:hypothetical protein